MKSSLALLGEYLITVVPTRASLNFIGLATWEALSGRQVPVDLWSNVHEVPHIKLAKNADAIIIAPATADLLAKIASGRADDLLTNMVLATKAPIILVPSMHTEMWLNPATLANIQILRSRGFLIVEPDSGRLTGIDVGVGRYPEVSKILDCVKETLNNTADLVGKRVLISAGGTREAIDPVRYIGNHSSGKQGYALAYSAAKRGAEVVLVSANSTLPEIEGITTIHVSTTLQMQEVMESHFDDSDLVFLAAAVADVRPAKPRASKIGKDELITIDLVQNPDIAQTLATKRGSQVIVGFAAQTEDELESGVTKAREKLKQKKLDIIYFNNVLQNEFFGSDDTQGVIITSSGAVVDFPRESKVTLANKLLDFALDKLG